MGRRLYGRATTGGYGEAEPGVIGAGGSLIRPAFSNDLHDSHRLTRRGRLRAGLGASLNVPFTLALAAVHRVIGFGLSRAAPSPTDRLPTGTR